MSSGLRIFLYKVETFNVPLLMCISRCHADSPVFRNVLLVLSFRYKDAGGPVRKRCTRLEMDPVFTVIEILYPFRIIPVISIYPSLSLPVLESGQQAEPLLIRPYGNA